jgi:hypothetical protein
MVALNDSEIAREARLINTFAQSYVPKFAQLVDKLNQRKATGSISADEAASLRLCVEAMGMVVATQARLAQLIERTQK